MDEIKIVDIHKSESEIYIMQYKPMKTLFNKLKSYCNGEVIIDDVDKRLIGFVFVGDKKDNGFISNLWVSTKYRRNGYGSLLLKDAIKKYNGIDLIVKKSNLPAINLYKKNGFVCIKFEDPMSKKYYWMKLKTKLTKNDEIFEI